MGLQATSPPTSPLHRPPPPHPGSIGSSTPMLKRKHDLVEDDDEDVLMSVTTGGSGVKKICVEVVASHNVVSNMNRNNDRLNNSDEDIEDFSSDSDEANSSSDDESKSSSMLDDSIMLTESSNESTCAVDDNKENQVNVNKVLNKNGELESILAKTLLNSSASAQSSNSTSNNTELPNKNDNDHCPKVIVEHKPLPSIYDLQQMSAACDTLEDDNMQTCNNGSTGPKENDSGVSDDEDEVSSDLEDEEAESGDEEDEEPSPSPIFDPVLRGTTPGKHNTLPSPPKSVYGNDQRSFWNQNAYNQQPQQPQSNTFQFLEQTTQRIECAENGKSYLQLGTMNHAAHHHLPVTPVIQPKPNMVYRRPIPPFRTNHMVSAISSNLPSAFGSASSQSVSQPRPVCDHSNCLQKKNSFCYQSQRSRMLNLSLSKLHMARQSHDGSLRRSVLICNMLRYIEDETDREASAETVSNPIPPQQYGAMETEHHQYWPPVSQPQPQQPPQQAQPQAAISSPVSTNGGLTGVQDNPVYNMATGQSQPQSGQPQPQNYSTEPYEATLKDFNSAFRSTPYASPAHPGSDLDSGLGLGDNSEMERGINWSSVLSLTSGSQSELDPLNNNTFATEAWPNTANTPTTLSSVQQPTLTDISSSTVASSRTSSLSDLATSMVTSSAVSTSVTTVQQTSFDDIGWKLSADDVLKAFPNDENLFGAVTGP